MSAPVTCSKCSSQIDGKYCKAGSRSFHPACFVCSVCRKPITGSFDGLDESSFRCSACVTNAAPKCRGCSAALLDKYISLSLGLGGEGLTICHSCFKCKRCQSLISAKETFSGSVPGQFQCAACDRLDAPQCSSCGAPCAERYMNSSGRIYCEACFVCVSCRAKIEGSFATVGLKRLKCAKCCEADLPTCASCLQTCKEDWIIQPEACFHPKCFCCMDCREQISGSFAVRGRGFLCEKCALAAA